MDEYIIHYGVKGMKWGVRKDNYNVKKGPALTTGSNGYSNPVASGINKFIAGGHPEASRRSSGKTEEQKKKSNENTEKAIKGMNALGKTSKSGSSAAKKIGEATRTREDLSQMSDAELQKRVNRMNLERNYDSLTQYDTKSGWEKASEILDIAGDVVMIGVGIATIYKTFKKA